MKRAGVWIALGLVVIYAVLVVVLNQNAAQPLALAGSSTSPAANGSLAIKNLWRQLGLPFESWNNPPELLQTGNDVLVSVQPLQYTPVEARSILAFVKRGGTVVWADAQSDALLLALGLQSRNIPHGTTVTAQALALRSHSGVAVRTFPDVEIPVTSQLTGSGLQQAKSVGYIAGHPVEAQYQLGKGRIDVWATPALWENGYIGRGNNFAVVWNEIGNKSLLWDEFGHGIASDSAWSLLFGHGRVIGLLLLVLSLVLYGWRANVRTGPAFPATDDAPRVGREFLQALGWHFRRRRLQGEACKWMNEAVRLRLAKWLGLPADASVTALRETASKRQDAALQTRVEKWANVAQSGNWTPVWRTSASLLEWLDEAEDGGMKS